MGSGAIQIVEGLGGLIYDRYRALTGLRLFFKETLINVFSPPLDANLFFNKCIISVTAL